MPEKRKIALVLSDVDGTLVTEEKILTDRAQKAVREIMDSGIRFAITSGRPPLGMADLLRQLQLDSPTAGFNGGIYVDNSLVILEEKILSRGTAQQAIELIRGGGLDVWVYSGKDWFVTKEDAPHVAREAWTVKFQPKVVTDFGEALDNIAKIVGVSDDRDHMQKCTGDVQSAIGKAAAVSRSQPYYLDVTHKDANKGAVVAYLAKYFDISPDEIATIGDQPNDVLMFDRSGFSIAMGNAADDVKSKASAVTDSYNDEGFAKAMERYILDKDV
jgi:Cof subfamily protein (haloacid dehalogenase superfamily)